MLQFPLGKQDCGKRETATQRRLLRHAFILEAGIYESMRPRGCVKDGDGGGQEGKGKLYSYVLISKHKRSNKKLVPASEL